MIRALAVYVCGKYVYNYNVALVATCIHFRDLLLENIPFYINLAMSCPKNIIKQYLAQAFRGQVKYNSEIRHGRSTRCVRSLNCEVNSIRIPIPRHTSIHHKIYWKLSPSRRTLNVNAMVFSYDGKVYNYYNTHDKLLKTLEETDCRIKADHLRILRYFRFE